MLAGGRDERRVGNRGGIVPVTAVVGGHQGHRPSVTLLASHGLGGRAILTWMATEWITQQSLTKI